MTPVTAGRRSVLRGPMVALAGFLSLGVILGMKQYVMPCYDPCPVCLGQGVVSCGAPGCDRGHVPCDGACLKKDAQDGST